MEQITNETFWKIYHSIEDENDSYIEKYPWKAIGKLPEWVRTEIELKNAKMFLDVEVETVLNGEKQGIITIIATGKKITQPTDIGLVKDAPIKTGRIIPMCEEDPDGFEWRDYTVFGRSKKMDGGVRYAFCTKNGEKTWVYEEEEFTGNPEKHPYWAFRGDV